MSLSLFFVVLLGYHAQATPDFRIVSGTTAPDGIAPYQVSLSYNGVHRCGGSILNNRWLVTAAHCVQGVEPTQLKIRMGSNLNNKGGVVIDIEKFIIHEQYKQVLYPNGVIPLINDIALIKVATNITFSDNIQPIELTAEDTPEGLGVLATGWGVTEQEAINSPIKLQMLTLTTMNTYACQLYHLERTNIQLTNLCTIAPRGQGMCSGDSGGPLVYNNRLVGVFSAMIPCATGMPDIFTRVHSYVDWIESKISAN